MARECSNAEIQLDLCVVLKELMYGMVPWPLFLFGGVGAGKTCAALCVGNSAGGWLVEFPEFCKLILWAQKDELFDASDYKRTEASVWEDVESVNLLVLDELGTRSRPTDPQQEMLRGIIRRREGKPTIYISNLDAENLKEIYDDRVASRICSGTLFELTGPDRRIEAAGD